MPSSPPLTPRPLEMAIVSGAPAIRKTASTLPTRSTTATWAATLRACASPTACAITRSTSAAVRKLPAGTGAAGGEEEPPPPEHPASAARASAMMRSLRSIASRHARAGLRREQRIPRMARVVECVAKQAIRRDLALDGPRPAVAVAALRDRGHGHVGGLLRGGDVVAVGALHVEVHLVVEDRARHPVVVRPYRRDRPSFALARDRVARLAHPHLEELGAHLARLAGSERERAAALVRAGLARAPQQARARHAEGLLEAVGLAAQREARVELLDHGERLGGLSVGHLARRDRRLELQLVAFLAMLRHRDRLEPAARGIGLV